MTIFHAFYYAFGCHFTHIYIKVNRCIFLQSFYISKSFFLPSWYLIIISLLLLKLPLLLWFFFPALEEGFLSGTLDPSQVKVVHILPFQVSRFRVAIIPSLAADCKSVISFSPTGRLSALVILLVQGRIQENLGSPV